MREARDGVERTIGKFRYVCVRLQLASQCAKLRRSRGMGGNGHLVNLSSSGPNGDAISAMLGTSCFWHVRCAYNGSAQDNAAC